MTVLGNHVFVGSLRLAVGKLQGTGCVMSFSSGLNILKRHDKFWREYGHPYLPQRKSSHRVEGEVTTCNQSIRDFLLLLICRCSALSYCQFWMCWLWNFKLGSIIFFCHVLANCLDTNRCYF